MIVFTQLNVDNLFFGFRLIQRGIKDIQKSTSKIHQIDNVLYEKPLLKSIVGTKSREIVYR